MRCVSCHRAIQSLSLTINLMQRLLAWLTNRHTVRECSLYPRYTGRATP